MDNLKTSEAQRKASVKWQKENYVRIPLDVRPEEKERIKNAAKKENMTVGGYIKEAINEKIEREEKRMNELEILMLDGCTKSEAEKHLKNGTVVFSDFPEAFTEYMNEWDIVDEEEQNKYRYMVETKIPLPDWGVVQKDGSYFFIMYVL